ncbi:DNA cytosine methyltransferase [Phycicoccus sp. M110.8]|uniref:DNA cytosine methyltransferase n=1 Tax=Phycicoccus sp. M110.8 TaxID=3075433 RepID=UPI0028FDAED7|nr:DNA cytosine methyltransferase [Phycicoccus sp. M110.8]MDU0314405.1 DNA cytosine methyltransferase [Phycicoccus sp. M110.8]
MSRAVIDLFAGCGGFGRGLEQAGFETVYVNELHPDALSTYLLNHRGRLIDRKDRHSNDILDVTRNAGQLSALADSLRDEHGEIALVTGGPPCQGFSGIGHRRTFGVTKTEIPSNHLYREMATFIQAIRPRAFVFENVRGLLSAKWLPEGEKGEIWRDVQKAFRSITFIHNGRVVGYEIRSALVFAQDYGVPQNRPRVLLVGIRSDLNPALSTGDDLVADGFLPRPTGVKPPDPVDILSDLVDPQWKSRWETTEYLRDAETEYQERMRTLSDGTVLRAGAVLREQQYSRHADHVMARFQHVIDHGHEHLPEELRTKKFNQRVIPRVWGPNGPKITATSLPDDYIHYEQPRTPTVREMARLQGFPDWYQFAGKRTTGGRRRAGDPSIGDWARELPKYTQIGNAVPVELAMAVGKHLIEILDL